MSKQRAEIKITQTGIGGILKLHNLRVPSHQRDYSWSEKEVTKLFQDLAKAISDDEAVRGGTFYLTKFVAHVRLNQQELLLPVKDRTEKFDKLCGRRCRNDEFRLLGRQS